MSLPTPLWCDVAAKNLLGRFAKPVLRASFSHKTGIKKLIPSNITITADIDCQTIVDTPSSAVLALSNRLKTITETAKLAVMTIGRDHLLFFSSSNGVTAPPIITGNSGKIHGAATVSAPA